MYRGRCPAARPDPADLWLVAVSISESRLRAGSRRLLPHRAGCAQPARWGRSLRLPARSRDSDMLTATNHRSAGSGLAAGQRPRYIVCELAACRPQGTEGREKLRIVEREGGEYFSHQYNIDESREHEHIHLGVYSLVSLHVYSLLVATGGRAAASPLPIQADCSATQPSPSCEMRQGQHCIRLQANANSSL